MYKRYTFGDLGLHTGVASGYRNRKLHTMKNARNEVRKKKVMMVMTESEYEQAEKFRKKTTERYLSTYIRKVCLQKPVRVKYRNQSADDFLQQMLELKKELHAIGNNFSQAVHILHLLDKIPEFRDWIQQHDALYRAFIYQTERIHFKINELYERWLLK
jgi:hypothetical protein